MSARVAGKIPVLVFAMGAGFGAASASAQETLLSGEMQIVRTENPMRLEYRLPAATVEFAQPPMRFRPNGSAGPAYGRVPTTVRHTYGFDLLSNQGQGQTIGIVDAYDDPNIEADLGVFNQQMGLPSCTKANGCFQHIYATGKKPAFTASWTMEIALDVEWAHAMAPKANIVLVEAASNGMGDLFHAVDVAVQSGASVITMSWGAGEGLMEAANDTHFAHNGVTFTASSGDQGSGVEYPAASPYVVSVGGTSLTTDASGAYQSESAWAGSSGGESGEENEPTFQALYPVPNDSRGRRGVPDVSFDGNPSTGFAIYNSVSYSGFVGWYEVGGTSAGSPQWAALFAIANSMRTAGRKRLLTSTPGMLYTLAKASYAAYFHDVTTGTNGTCGVLCTAGTKYDFVTGLGTPRADALVPALVGQP
jgi:subtilase family serine protease